MATSEGRRTSELSGTSTTPDTSEGRRVSSADDGGRAAIGLRFDFADTLGLPGPVCFAHPDRVIVAHTLDEVRPAIHAVEAATRDGWYAAGFVAYEAARAFDDALETQLAGPMPLVWFGLFRGPVSEPAGPSAAVSGAVASSAAAATAPGSTATVSTATGSTATGSTATVSAAALSSAATSTAATSTAGISTTTGSTSSATASDGATVPALTWAPDITRDAYRDGIDAVKAAIARGDTYQVNYTFRLRASSAPADREALDALYEALLRTHHAPYAASLDLGRWRILSLSPELFLRLVDRRVVTRPMKGTAARAPWLAADEARGAWLAASEKNRAENVMIVDLARNDIGRVATIGSVRATRLFEVERYPSVWQMVSTVEGALRPEATLTDVVAALFPAGSITGAPKSSSMRLIAAIEAAPRGVYCGAIGYVTPGGQAIFNVAIRTAVFDRATGRAEYGVGGGITWDSTVADEYAEALSKAAALAATPVFDLLETMRLDERGYARRARHLARLRESAAYWDIPYDGVAIEAALDAHAATGAHGGTLPRRVRLRLSRAGEVRIESTPLDAARPAAGEPAAPAPAAGDRVTRDPAAPGLGGLSPPAWNRAGPLLVALARTPVSRADRFLYHKTTARAVYEGHKAERPGLFDVLLWNEARELTEFTIGNVVVEIDGVRWTPPRHCGLLAGTLRAELIDAGAIHERIVTIDDLARATRLWLINSVREWVPVQLIA